MFFGGNLIDSIGVLLTLEPGTFYLLRVNIESKVHYKIDYIDIHFIDPTISSL